MALTLAASSSNYIDHGTAASVDNLDPFTWLVWIRPAGTTAAQLLIKQGGPTGWSAWRDGNDVEFYTSRAVGSTECAAASVFTDGEWAFMVGTYADHGGTDDMMLYKGDLDTPAVDVRSFTSFTGSGAIGDNSGENMFVGLSGNPFDGDLAWFALVAAEMTLEQVEMVQYKPHLINLFDCRICTEYGISAGASDLQVDHSGNGNHGTVVGTPPLVAHFPVAARRLWTPGTVTPAVVGGPSAGLRTLALTGAGI